jgi:transmembrane sensor
MADGGNIIDQAIDWHVRQRDMADHEWHEFVRWLEADPAHAEAFDAVALEQSLIAGYAAMLDPPARIEPANDDTPPARRHWRWAAGGAAMAAAVTGVLVVPSMLQPGADLYTVATQPGEQRSVALDSGTSIDLNGGSRVTLDRNNPRFAALEEGEATFHVRHDAANPFVLRSGAVTVEDLGTVFNVVRDGKRLDIEVAEGSVLFQPGREAVTLEAGSALSAREDLRQVSLSKIETDKVGGWRNRLLTFRGEPVARVAASFRRLDGAILVIDPALSSQPFTGMLRLSGRAERDVPQIAALIGAKWRYDGERWILSPSEGNGR